MSDTPRTESAKSEHDFLKSSDLVKAEFARQLERENAALREDKERLDWLGKQCCCIEIDNWFINNKNPYYILPTRAAIDAARKEQP